MEKVIIINWRWITLTEEFTKMTIQHQEKNVCYFCDFDENNIKELNDKLNEISCDKKLLLLHKGNNILKDKITAKIDFIEEFNLGQGAVYRREENNNKGIIDPDANFNAHILNYYNNNVIPSMNFEFVWKSYSETKPLKDQKKNLINLWLPLAIDMQGLKDLAEQEKITDIKSINKENKIYKYYEEIKNEVVSKDYEKEIINKWNELKVNLTADIKNKELPNQIVETLKNNKSKLNKFYKKFIKNSNQNSFLPNWLQETVSALEEKINQSK